jgi:hypothetical protein
MLEYQFEFAKIDRETDLLNSPRGQQENQVLNAAIDRLIKINNLNNSQDDQSAMRDSSPGSD